MFHSNQSVYEHDSNRSSSDCLSPVNLSCTVLTRQSNEASDAEGYFPGLRLGSFERNPENRQGRKKFNGTIGTFSLEAWPAALVVNCGRYRVSNSFLRERHLWAPYGTLIGKS